jgi:hypothetical protein
MWRKKPLLEHGTMKASQPAHFLYVSQRSPKKRAKLLGMVLSNCAVDDLNIYRSHKKPFDLILARAKNEKWRARLESKSSGFIPPGPAVARTLSGWSGGCQDFAGQALATAPCDPAAGTFPR